MAPERWLPFLLGLFIVGAVLGLPLLTTIAAALGITLGVTAWWRTHALDELIYRRKPNYRRAFPGEKVEMTIEVENRKLLPLSWLRVEDPWPIAVGPEDEHLLAPHHVPDHGLFTNIYSLRWFEKVRRRFVLKFKRRGVYKLGPVRMQSGDPFGLYEHSREMDQVEYLTVFPDLYPLETLLLQEDDPTGERKSRRRLFEDPNRPAGVRDYRPEDTFRHIHWPATARTGQLQVKVYLPAMSQVTVVCLNVSTYQRPWEGFNPELLERLVSVAASLVSTRVQEGYQVGLISNSCLAHSDRSFRIPPGRSLNQLPHLLQALAGVTPLVLAPFEKFLLRQMPSLHYRASLQVISAIITPELVQSLLRLRRSGREVTLFSLSTESELEIPGIRVLQVPIEEDQVA